jgi:hypothetical protein
MAEAGQELGGGQLNVQSCDLLDCKELEQPVPLQASLCRKNVFVIMKDNPCKVRFNIHITTEEIDISIIILSIILPIIAPCTNSPIRNNLCAAPLFL